MKEERLQTLINDANESHEFHLIHHLKSLASQFDQLRRDLSVRSVFRSFLSFSRVPLESDR